MLYTAVPLERIYAQQPSSSKQNDNDTDYKDISLEYGRIKAKREKDHYIVERIESTNMSDYLMEEYSPGAVIQVEQDLNS